LERSSHDLRRDLGRAGARRPVELRGFGAFSVKQRNARPRRNPRTGDAVAVERKAVRSFKTGSSCAIA